MRRKSNHIDCLKDTAGNWISTRAQVGEAFMQRFRSTYDKVSHSTNISLHYVISLAISEEENNRLISILD